MEKQSCERTDPYLGGGLWASTICRVNGCQISGTSGPRGIKKIVWESFNHALEWLKVFPGVKKVGPGGVGLARRDAHHIKNLFGGQLLSMT